MPTFPILQTEDIVQSGDKTRLDGSKSFASGAAKLTAVSIRPKAGESFYSTGEEQVLDWVYEHSGGPTDPEVVTATVRAHIKTVIDATNNKLDFELSGTPSTIRTATVAVGEYDSYVDLFAAVVAALQAATLTPFPDLVWSMELGDDGKTVITLEEMDNTSGDTLSLLPVTGPNASESILPVLGFNNDLETTVALIDDPTLNNSTQNFNNDTGFTYDSDLTEFIDDGEPCVRQKDLRPADAVFGANFNLGSVNANWANGSVVGTALNGAKVTGNRLDLTGGVGAAVEYVAAGNTEAIGHTGCVRFKYTPNYTGAPTANQSMILMCNADGDTRNAIQLLHLTNGSFFLLVNDNTGTNIYSNSLAPYAAVAGETVEIEIAWDSQLGFFRVWGQGFLFADISGTWTRDDSGENYFSVGTKDLPGSDFFLEDLIVFSVPQHTTNYSAPSAAPADYPFEADVITLPAIAYGGPGTIQEVASFLSTEASGVPHYSINGKYWNGTAWVTSTGAYAQANTLAQIQAHIATLDLNGAASLIVKIATPQGSTRARVDTMVFAYVGQIPDTQVEPEGDVAPVALHVEKSVTLRVVTAATDNLFSDDAELIKHEWNIMRFVADGRASFLDVHRKAQSLILAWLDTHGFVDDFGHKFTVEDIKDPEDLKQWSTMMALRLIFEGVHNAKDDVFKEKAKEYEGLEEFYRNRSNMRLDLNEDGVTNDFELLDTRSCRVVRR